MCVCVCVCMYVCMYVCTYVYIPSFTIAIVKTFKGDPVYPQSSYPLIMIACVTCKLQ